MFCKVILRDVICLTALFFASVSLHGCGARVDATTTTTTTLASPDGIIQLSFSRQRTGADGGADSCIVTSSPISFSAGVVVNVTADDFRDQFHGESCVEIDCDPRSGSCAQVTVSEVMDPASINMKFYPRSVGISSSDLCRGKWQESVLAKGNADAVLCHAQALDVVCVEPIGIGSSVSNMWNPDPSDPRPFSNKVCSDANPRRRCISEGLHWNCWDVTESEVCPSEPGSCTLDPTCECGDDMVKTTIVGGTNYTRSTHAWSDVGAWCWRCEDKTHVSCPAQTSDDDILSPDECSSQNCDCPQQTSWPASFIKQTWYTDPQRTSMVKKGTSGATPCYTCGGPGAYYTQTQPMNIIYTVSASVSLFSPTAPLGGGNDSTNMVADLLI